MDARREGSAHVDTTHPLDRVRHAARVHDAPEARHEQTTHDTAREAIRRLGSLPTLGEHEQVRQALGTHTPCDPSKHAGGDERWQRDTAQPVDAADLEGYRRKQRQDAEARIASVLRGREKFEHNSHGGGTTNTEKARHKNYLMVSRGNGTKYRTSKGVKSNSTGKRKLGHKISGGKKQDLAREKRKRRRT